MSSGALPGLLARSSDSHYWLFGFGSLIWKPDIPYVEKRLGYVESFVRRFWQGSPDHRGTPDALGRVVSLFTREEVLRLRNGDGGMTCDPARYDIEERVWGMAFKVEERVMLEELAKLEYREKAGYEKIIVDVCFDDDESRTNSTIKALAFRATLANEYFLGPQEYSMICKCIKLSCGESGPNIEYFMNLYHALLKLQKETGKDDIMDPHLLEIYKNLAL